MILVEEGCFTRGLCFSVSAWVEWVWGKKDLFFFFFG